MTAHPQPRSVEVTPERLPRWLAGFAERHGAVRYEATAARVDVTGEDGARASCAVPFPPLTEQADLPYAGLLAHASAKRRVGVLLVRRGGYAAGVFDGTRLGASKVGTRYVQGRSKAGGWSQHRFARRRDQQARQAFEAAADTAARVLLPVVAELDAVVCGGDRRAIDAVLADPRLGPVRERVIPPLYSVPDPRLRVLQAMPSRFRAIHITLTQPDG